MKEIVCSFTVVCLLGVAGCTSAHNPTVQDKARVMASQVDNTGPAAIPNMLYLKELTTRTSPESINDPNTLAEAFPRLANLIRVQTSDDPQHLTTYSQKTNEAILTELANHEVYVRTYSVDAEGKVSFLPGNIAGKGKKVVIQQDYVNYKLVQLEGQNKRVGVMLRVQAELVTKSAEVNLNGLFAIGLAVRAGSAIGTLRICVFGLSGEPISSLIPMPSDISESSLQNAMQAVASLKAKIYDPKVSISPQVIPD